MEYEVKKKNENFIPAAAIRMAGYAYRSVPLYIELAEEKMMDGVVFSDLPVVGKKDYMNFGGMCLSVDYVTQYLAGRLLVRKSSGSTGKITDCYWSLEDERKSLLELWYYRRKYYNIFPSDKMTFFFPISLEEQEITQSNNVQGISKAFLYNDRLKEAYYQMMEFGPKWLIIQPSIAWMLCELIQKEDLPILDSINYIEFTGEFLEKTVRKRVEKMFCCKTANQYGMVEVNSIAYECPYGNMHIMGNNVYVEILNEHEQCGDICITSLKNMAMPLIRYNTGDKGYLLFQDCPCGNIHPILKVYNGRNNDWILKQNGEKIHPFSLLQVINEINERYDYIITQYQIIQKKYDYFVYNLVIREGTDAVNLENVLCKMTAHRLQESLTISFFYFDSIVPDRKTGKLAAFFCDIN